MTPQYYVGFQAHFDLTPGAAYRYTAGGGDVITGTVLAVEHGALLRTTFDGHWDPAVAALPESVVSFTVFPPLMPVPGVTCLSCQHDGLPDTEAARHVELGWVTILSGLKTLLETGEPLVPSPS